MDPVVRIEGSLEFAIAEAAGGDCPPLLAAALRHSVFPGGARLRPRLCLSVAMACGKGDREAALAAATAIEIIHCASLVHDDLPCFDDAPMRRGRPSVQAEYGPALAVLAGDALIVLAFETLARRLATRPQALARLVTIVGRAAGAPHGITAGQAFESEAVIDTALYHRAKTGALFAAASEAGAAACGAPSTPWRHLGAYLGEAYQVADDIRDAAGDEAELGKPVGIDAKLGRPNAVRDVGIPDAIRRLDELVEAAIESVPLCPGRERMHELIRHEASRFLPEKLARRAA